MAIVALLNPVIGYTADVSCGRFKVVIFCFGLVIFPYCTIYITAVTYYSIIKVKQPFVIIIFIVFTSVLLALNLLDFPDIKLILFS